ncbi:hypothetical protein [Petrocella sp. FN5]|uniref:hypothetical protein n=1 Tax=Petrocella sp. FN5 TaxID=3032002 RepID=UPI0023D9D22D|nr:hypothetical protein [Petrocella sp. FN5]MDF1617907.1 hypothetical protein [Petrocella sp. FN5]
MKRIICLCDTRVRSIFLISCLVMMILCLALSGCSASHPEKTAGVQEVSERNESKTPEDWGNTMDFSGTWAGTQLIAEVSNEEMADMEGTFIDCWLDLSFEDYHQGTGKMQLADALAGPNLTALVSNNRLTLTGELWESPFQWNGTFEMENNEWHLVGGGDIQDGDMTIHFVLSLSLDPDSLAQEPGITSTAEASEISQEGSSGDITFGPPIQGERFETEKVSMVVPTGWNVMEISDGLQAYQGKNAVEVWVRGSGLGEDAAKKAIEGMARDYNGSDVESFQHWGLNFYSTDFEIYGMQQMKMSAVINGQRIEIGLAMDVSADDATEDLLFGMLDTIEFN